MNKNNKKYRANVGIMIINQKKNIFVGQRLDHPSHFWQMPQGGIDPNEKPIDAAFREAFEETGIKKNKLKLILELKNWYYYDLPLDLAKTLWKGKYIGQKQKWFLFDFIGTDPLVELISETKAIYKAAALSIDTSAISEALGQITASAEDRRLQDTGIKWEPVNLTKYWAKMESERLKLLERIIK